MSLFLQHHAVIVASCSWHEGKQIKALCQGPQYGKPLDEKIKDVEKQSTSVQRCIDRLWREATARTEHLATNIKTDTGNIQADTRQLKEDSTVSRAGIARMEANQANLVEMIQKMMQKNMESLLQENVRNKECKNHSTNNSEGSHQEKTLMRPRDREARACAGKIGRPSAVSHH